MTSAAPGRSSGFSLIEVLIAMFILSIGAASVLSFYAAAASTHKRSIDRTHAALVAERVFSEVQGRYEIGKTAEELMEELDKAGMPRSLEDYQQESGRELPNLWGGYSAEVYCFHPAGGQGRRKLGAEEEDAESEVDWLEQELFVRVIIRWKQKASSRSETFHTLMLPRNARSAGGR